MTKEQALEIIKLLSAVESWSFSAGHMLPDYLHDRLSAIVEDCSKLVLDGE